MVALILSCALIAWLSPLNVIRLGAIHVMRTITRQSLDLPYAPPPEQWQSMNATDRLTNVHTRLLPKLHDELTSKQLKLGQPAFIRIFKESRELELWLKGGDDHWHLFRTYPIACYSGTLGPKTREGDMQAPEGFYSVTQNQLNPASSYHLSFNVGYPNAYDLHYQRTGSLIMIHGDVCSVGCFAMTDPLIEEIYLIVEAAVKDGSSVPIHIFPFRMTEERMKSADPTHLDFWRNLQRAYNHFENSHQIPRVALLNGLYFIQ